MGWYAVENIEDAVDETKDLLLPFDLKRWLKLALIVLFTVGIGGGLNMPSSLPSDTGTDTPGLSGTETSGTAYAPDASIDSVQNFNPPIENSITGLSTATSSLSNTLTIAALMGIMVLAVLFTLISSIFEFIFYQSLMDKDVKIRKNFSRHFMKGLRYFGFRLAFIFVLLLVIAIIAGLFKLNPVFGGLATLIGLPLIIGMFVFAGLTKDFALLKMTETEDGLIDSWRQLWPELREEWKQTGIFILVKFFLKLAIGIIGLILVLIVTLVLLIPLGIMGVLLYMVSPTLALIALIPGVILWIFLVLMTKVPLQTYLYSYVILVYHDLTQ